MTYRNLLRQHVLVSFTLAMANMAIAQTPHPTPPPEPNVKPIVTAPVEVDKDQTKIDDGIERRVRAARRTISRKDASTTEVQSAKSDLAGLVRVELVFSKQITQPQIDAFIKAGGQIDKVFTHVSYGWTGSISREAAVNLPAALGASLLGIVEDSQSQLHLDEAGRTGRVRPTVWNMGFKGKSTGPDRITIGILDTGVDPTHTDLAGRMAFWTDTTSDSLATAQDIGHHGSHVAGIAVGTGASSGVSPSQLRYTDISSFSTSANVFFLNPIHVPTSLSTFNWTARMNWDSGSGYSSRFGLRYRTISDTWNEIIPTTSNTTSPIDASVTGYQNPNPGSNNIYTAAGFLTQSNPGNVNYAISNTVDYVGLGDGYNLLSGVAPNAAWAGVKVFRNDGGGSTIDINEGIDEIVANREANDVKIINMSLGVIGSPGYNTTTRNKTNTAAMNGILTVVSAGNDGRSSSGGSGEIDDPGRANYAITVASSSDINRLTAYSSHGFLSPGHAAEGDEDMKPDIMAPGGSAGFQSSILSADSNTSDNDSTGGLQIADQVPNDYKNIQGTSMAAPYIAGCLALMVDAMQTNGYEWTFTGPEALEQVLAIKAKLLMTATETNDIRESGASTNPVLGRGSKDINEGYGIVNGDAAVEMVAYPALPAISLSASDSFGSEYSDRRCWARKINLSAHQALEFNLEVPGTGDYDLYLYDTEPNEYGNPVILASSVNVGLNSDESIEYTATNDREAFVVVKRVSGSGNWTVGSLASASLWTLY